MLISATNIKVREIFAKNDSKSIFRTAKYRNKLPVYRYNYSLSICWIFFNNLQDCHPKIITTQSEHISEVQKKKFLH